MVITDSFSETISIEIYFKAKYVIICIMYTDNIENIMRVGREGIGWEEGWKGSTHEARNGIYLNITSNGSFTLLNRNLYFGGVLLYFLGCQYTKFFGTEKLEDKPISLLSDDSDSNYSHFMNFSVSFFASTRSLGRPRFSQTRKFCIYIMDELGVITTCCFEFLPWTHCPSQQKALRRREF